MKPIDAYVAYGYITYKSVVELVNRRAYTTTTDGVRKPLSDNIIVEKILGDKNILCLSDLSHEIFNVGVSKYYYYNLEQTHSYLFVVIML